VLFFDLKRKTEHLQETWIPAVLPNLLFFKEKNKRIFPPIGAKRETWYIFGMILYSMLLVLSSLFFFTLFLHDDKMDAKPVFHHQKQ
jgi:disulfide bond formation protein DsbB